MGVSVAGMAPLFTCSLSASGRASDGALIVLRQQVERNDAGRAIVQRNRRATLTERKLEQLRDGTLSLGQALRMADIKLNTEDTPDDIDLADAVANRDSPTKSSPSRCFTTPGMDAKVTNRLGAATQLDSQRVPGEYAVRFSIIQGHVPCPTFYQRPAACSRKQQADDETVLLEEATLLSRKAKSGNNESATTCGTSTWFSSCTDEPTLRKEPMAMQLARPDLALKSGVQMNEKRLQDRSDDSAIRTRSPAWNFEKMTGRPTSAPTPERLQAQTFKAAPISMAAVHASPKQSVAFSLSLARSTPEITWGHQAPPAVLQSRHVGGLRDLSRAKDAIAHRAVQVNDFEKELPRPPLNAKVEAEETLPSNELVSNEADRCARHRRKALSFGKNLPRGRKAVQGPRILQDDRGVRGAVGLGIIDTQSEFVSIEQLEARGVHSESSRPDKGLVEGLGFRSTSKVEAALRRPFSSVSFKRPYSAGFMGQRESLAWMPVY